MRVTASPPCYSGGCRAPPSGRAEPSRAVPGRAAMAMDGECGRKVPEGRCLSPGLPSRRLVVVGGRGAGGGLGTCRLGVGRGGCGCCSGFEEKSLSVV